MEPKKDKNVLNNTLIAGGAVTAVAGASILPAAYKMSKSLRSLGKWSKDKTNVAHQAGVVTNYVDAANSFGNSILGRGFRGILQKNRKLTNIDPSERTMVQSAIKKATDPIVGDSFSADHMAAFIDKDKRRAYSF